MALEIELKEDSPEKLIAVNGKPTKYYLFAEEFNSIVDYINSLEQALQVVPFGKGTIYKAQGNLLPTLEVQDVFVGFLADGSTFIPFGAYLGGDATLITNYNTSPITF